MRVGGGLMEVPLLVPSADVRPIRFIVNDTNRTIRRDHHGGAVDHADWSSSSNSSNTSNSSSFVDEALLRGAASATSLGGDEPADDNRSTTRAFLTTCALPEKPWILVVSLLSTSRRRHNVASSPPPSIQLDLQSKMSSSTFSGQIVKVKGFRGSSDHDAADAGLIRLILVDSVGTILIFQLDSVTLEPLEQLVVISLQDLIADEMDNSNITLGGGSGSGSSSTIISLRSSMISILSPSRMIVALNPYLISVDLKNTNNNNNNKEKMVATWSHSKCMEDKKTRQSRLSTFLAKGADLFSGKWNDIAVVDMAPCMAICAAENDPSLVFTLHADGILRRWKLNAKSSSSSVATSTASVTTNHSSLAYDMQPFDVTDIDLADIMPPPDTWSDADDALQLSSQLYQQSGAAGGGENNDESEVFLLAIYIQTVGGGARTSSTSNSSDGIGEGGFVGTAGDSLGCRLIAVEGSVSFDQASLIKTKWQGLQVPREAETNTSLVSMAFTHDRSSLIALFTKNVEIANNNDNDEKHYHRGDGNVLTYCLQYPPSTTQLVSPRPIMAPPDSLIDSLAVAEHSRIERLSFYQQFLKEGDEQESDVEDLDCSSTTITTPSLSLEDCLYEIDCKFLQYLFRPMWCRGTGHILPPANNKIRRALTKCVPHYNHSSSATTATAIKTVNIQVETLKAMHEWRKRENRPDLEAVRTPTKTPASARSAVRTATTPGWEGRTVRSIYQSLQPETMDVDGQEVEEENAVGGGSPENFVATMNPKTPRARGEVMADDDSKKRQQLKDHERRWRQLLLQIWKEERIENRPLRLALTDDVSEGSDEEAIRMRSDEAILLRGSGLTSTIVPYKRSLPTLPDNGDGLLTLLDKIAVRIVDSIERSHFDKLVKIEDKVLEIVGSASIAIDVTTIDDLENHIAVLCPMLWDVASQTELAELTESFKQESLADERLVQPPVDFCLPCASLLPPLSSQSVGAHGFQRQQQHLRGVEPPEIQVRLAAVNMAIKSLDTIRRLMLGRFVILSACGVGQTIRQGALRSFLHSTTLLCTSARRVPLPIMGISGGADLNSTTLQLDSEGRSPPKKRPSFESHTLSVLASGGTRDKTTALDSLLLSISQRHSMPGPVMSLSQQTAFLARAALAEMYGVVRSVTGERSNQNGVVLPELGLLGPSLTSGIDEPKIALLLHASYVALPPPSDSTIETEARLESLAQCLLMASESDPAGSAMARHAFSLLEFNVNDLEQGLRRMMTLKKQIQGGKSQLTYLLLAFIQDALLKIKSRYSHRELLEASDYARILSLMFQTSIGAQEWQMAFQTCMKYPDSKNRVDQLKRLVRSMVDAGHLTSLLAMISSTDETSSTDRYDEVFTSGLDLHAIASDTLARTGLRDWYIHAVQSPNQVSDYQGALYALHVVQQQWRAAARSLDLKFVNARNALVAHAGNQQAEQLYGEMATRREKMILDDLVLAALGCSNAIGLVEDAGTRFIVSGEQCEYPSLPVAVSKKKLPRPKRTRGTSSEVQGTVHQEEETSSRLSRILHPVDIESRAVRSLACRTLYVDATPDVDLANRALTIELTPISTDQAVIDALFRRGYYVPGLMLGELLEKTDKGSGFFRDATSHLLCFYLVPRTLGSESNVGRPTYGQLLSALDAMNSKASSLSLPPVLAGFHGSKKSYLSAGIRCASMQVLRTVTTRFSSNENQLAKDVARCLLNEHHPVVLPNWLEDLMMWGTHGKDDSFSGLFARRRRQKQVPKKLLDSDYLGDPSSLVHTYMMVGMYARACHVVTTVLSAGSQKANMASRLPEKGNTDFVPYDKIDMLYNLINIALDNGAFASPKEAKEVEDAKDSMVEALKNHFESLRISELGLPSARALGAS